MSVNSIRNKSWEKVFKHTEHHFHVGECALGATQYATIPTHDDERWIKGKPSINNTQEVLTLNSCYPTGLIVCVEKYSKSTWQYPNHSPFDGTIAHMSLELLKFTNIDL